MALNAELTVRLDASTLLNAFTGQLTGASSQLTAIPNPAGNGQLNGVSEAGGSFVPQTLLDAVSRFQIDIPGIPPLTIVDTIESNLAGVERLSSLDIPADLDALIAEVKAILQGGNTEGFPGALLKISELLKKTPEASALSGIVELFTSTADGFRVPNGAANCVPALASTVKAVAGLMVYESVLAEGERLTRTVEAQFQAARARQEAANLEASLSIGGQTLAAFVAAVDIASPDAIDAAIRALEQAAARLDAFSDYVSTGMGFGEATLVYFDPGRAQTEIAAAGLLLRHPDFSALRDVSASAAQLASPLLTVLDPGAATSRGMEAVIQLADDQAAQGAAAIRALDAGLLIAPLDEGLKALMQPLRDFTSVVAQATAEVRAVLEAIRSAIAQLSIADLATAIRDMLAPVTAALDFIRRLVADISAALETACAVLVDALGKIEGGVDAFQQEILDLFTQAKEFVDGLHLEQIASAINDKINEFVALLRQAQLKPYFDTASSAIGSAADVISAVPLDLVPASMKGDLDEALAPIRNVDVLKVEADIEGALQIGEDGKFELRGELEASLAEIQAKFEEVLATLEEHHPRKYVQQLDAQLKPLSAKIQSLAPELTLEPVQQAIAQIKGALGSFDLEHELQPVQSAFDTAMAGLQQASPTALLLPLTARVDQARAKVEELTRIDQWIPALEELQTLALEQLETLEESVFQARLLEALEELRGDVGNLPDVTFGSWLGSLVASLMDGTDLRIQGSSIHAVLGWLDGSRRGSEEMLARAAKIGSSLAAAQREVEAFDPAALNSIFLSLGSAASAAAALASRVTVDAGRSERLIAVSLRLDASAVLGGLSANRSRYLERLTSAAALGDALRRTGASEVDLAVAALQEATSPLKPILNKVRDLASFLGIGAQGFGLREIVNEVFAVAPPSRIVGLLTPLFTALQDRVRRLMDEILTPIRSAVGDLQAAIALISLQPIVDGIQSVFDEVTAQVLAFSPATLLRPQLDAFAALKQELLTFDPLGPILALLNGLRDAAARLIAKLSAERLLASPLAIYDTILGAVGQINVEALMTPVLDAVDEIALQVDVGLDETVEAFKRLQESLPPPGGGSSASVSVAVG